tara:strand:+ start:379 stop:573 length:195 start_codon:yes stop_codon:yes gene_type:complete
MTEEELEEQRCIDDDYNVINHYYRAKMLHPNIPFYLQDDRGQTFEFKWDLIYKYIGNINDGNLR